MNKSPFILIVILMAFCLISCDSIVSHEEHVFGGQKVTKEATCTEEGEAVVRCSCGETKTITLEKLGHDIVEEVTDPTYLKKGRVDYKCSHCDATGLKKSIELERLSLAGYGFEIFQTTGDYSSYSWLLFDEDNRVHVIGNTVKNTVDPIVLVMDESDYLIREKIDAEGNASYFLSCNPYEYQITEKNGELTVLDYYDGEKYVDIKLTKDIHKHSGTVINCVSTEDINNGTSVSAWDYCQYFICNCKMIENKTFKIFNHLQHMMGSDGKCIYCGATLHYPV